MSDFEFKRIGVKGHFLVETSISTSIPIGANVRVGDHPLERNCRDFEGVLTGFTKAHGFAAVYNEASDDHRLIHPEALKRVHLLREEADDLNDN